jgi:hypothetical protein
MMFIIRETATQHLLPENRKNWLKQTPLKHTLQQQLKAAAITIMKLITRMMLHKL